MILDIYQVDAFTSEVFKGNPAAVVPLSSWLPDDKLLNIAAENNLSETAFFVSNDDESFHLRWFTPTMEVSLCGHATLATSWVICNKLGYEKDKLIFQTEQSGELTVQRSGGFFTLNFPIWKSEKVDPSDVLVFDALEDQPLELYKGTKWVAIVDDPQKVINYNPNFDLINKIPSEGFVVTAAGGENGVDFTSRYFGPQVGIKEDPVTGSAHCMLAPIWSSKTGKMDFIAHQASERGGILNLRLDNDRVYITGEAVLYLKGKIYV